MRYSPPTWNEAKQKKDEIDRAAAQRKALNAIKEMKHIDKNTALPLTLIPPDPKLERFTKRVAMNIIRAIWMKYHKRKVETRLKVKSAIWYYATPGNLLIEDNKEVYNGNHAILKRAFNGEMLVPCLKEWDRFFSGYWIHWWIHHKSERSYEIQKVSR